MEFSDAILISAEIIGIVAFSVSGAITAINKNFDIFGVIFLGIITALGGGVIRDILLGILPPIMFKKVFYVAVAILCSLVTFLLRKMSKEYSERQRIFSNAIMVIFDAIGLGTFTVVGISTAINMGKPTNAFLAISVGVITGIGGGILRDILSGSVAVVLYKNFYAVASLIGGCIYFYINRHSTSPTLAMFVGIITIIVLRILATIYKWNLPKVQ